MYIHIYIYMCMHMHVCRGVAALNVSRRILSDIVCTLNVIRSYPNASPMAFGCSRWPGECSQLPRVPMDFAPLQATETVV